LPNLKLSQITPGTPLLNDQIVGVSGGVTDALFDVNALKGFITATSNVDWYVATTGSDSNPGTLLQPFATIQRALTEAARYNWVFIYFPTIHIADGTYPENDRQISIGDFVNLFETIIFVANPSNPQNVVLAQGFELFFSDGSIAIGGLSFSGVNTGSCINAVDGVISVSDPIIFNDNTQSAFYCEAFSFIFCNTTLTFTGSHIQWFSFNGPGVTWFSNPTIHFPASFNMDVAFFEVDGTYGNNGVGVAGVILGGPTITNGGGVTGTSLISFTGPALLTTQNGEISDIPGTNNGFLSSDLFITAFSAKEGRFFRQKSGLPTTSDIPTGCWSVFKDTSGGGMYVAGNDGGTIKKVALT
jgi:hypothetical protein